MRNRSLLVVVALLALVGAVQARTKPPVTPEAFVTAIYKDHFAHKQRWDLTAKNRANFTPELLALLDESDRKQAANPDEVVGLDFNPLTNSQENAQSFKVTGATREGADAVVTVQVKIYTETQTIRVKLSPSGNTWKIADLVYAEGDLISILKEAE